MLPRIEVRLPHTAGFTIGRDAWIKAHIHAQSVPQFRLVLGLLYVPDATDPGCRTHVIASFPGDSKQVLLTGIWYQIRIYFRRASCDSFTPGFPQKVQKTHPDFSRSGCVAKFAYFLFINALYFARLILPVASIFSLHSCSASTDTEIRSSSF